MADQTINDSPSALFKHGKHKLQLVEPFTIYVIPEVVSKFQKAYLLCVSCFRLQQYGSRCEWLKDDKFLRDLEGDSVDTEILDEELRSLQEDEPKT